MTFLSLGLILALPMRGLGADPIVDAPLPYKISPDTAPAGKPFTLRLEGVAADCNSFFTRESVTVTGKRIDLSFVNNGLIRINAGDTAAIPGQNVLCPEMAKDTLTGSILPYYDAPTYAMPALKAGAYEVWATEMYECLYTQPVCKIGVSTRYTGMLTVDADGKTAYSITPSTVKTGSDFELSLLSYDFTCATTYDMLASAVVGDTISLTFLDHLVDTLSICPAVYKPYGPSYKINGLRKGSYHVIAYRLPPCAAQGCKMAAVPADAGMLTVKDDIVPEPDTTGWFLKQREFPPNKAFAVQLLNNAYGNCQTSFSSPTLTIETGAIYFGFVVENHPEHVCITDIRPHGPVFEMPAMKPGAYPVYVEAWPSCVDESPGCRQLIESVRTLSDTLIVSRTSAILLSALRREAAGSAEFEGARVMVTLPKGAGGEWRAELMTVAGQRLGGATLRGESGFRTALDLGMRPERGVYILRLSAPDGKSHTLPLVRKD